MREKSAILAAEDLVLVGHAPRCPRCGVFAWPVVTGSPAAGFVLVKYRCPECHQDFAAPPPCS